MLTNFLNLLQMKCWISDSKWSYFFASLNVLDILSVLMFGFVFKNKWYLLIYLLASTVLCHLPYMFYTFFLTALFAICVNIQDKLG
jgi:hypothetical protein